MPATHVASPLGSPRGQGSPRKPLMVFELPVASADISAEVSAPRTPYGAQRPPTANPFATLDPAAQEETRKPLQVRLPLDAMEAGHTAKLVQ
eukprot:scaffold679670_cov37-Prasinocladus_malaysianus.AAC.1